MTVPLTPARLSEIEAMTEARTSPRTLHTAIRDLLAERAAGRKAARLIYASYYAWDRAVMSGTCHGSSERDRFEASLDALMEDLGFEGDKFNELAMVDPAEILREKPGAGAPGRRRVSGRRAEGGI